MNLQLRAIETTNIEQQLAKFERRIGKVEKLLAVTEGFALGDLDGNRGAA